MKSWTTVLVVISSVSFLYGLRPGVDLYGGWNYASISSGGASGSDNFVDMAMMVTAPFSQYIGLRAGIAGVNFGGGGTSLTIAGRIGLIEMIPGRNVSPYFTQRVTLDLFSYGGLTSTTLLLGAGVGIEFLSDSPVSPFFEGRFDFVSYGTGGSSADGIGIGLGGGIRFGPTKHKEIETKEIKEIKEKEPEPEL